MSSCLDCSAVVASPVILALKPLSKVLPTFDATLLLIPSAWASTLAATWLLIVSACASTFAATLLLIPSACEFTVFAACASIADFCDAIVPSTCATSACFSLSVNLAETVELRSATPSLNDFALELSVAIPDVRLGTLEFNVLSPVLIWFAPSV